MRGNVMKFKELKPIIMPSYLTIFESFPTFNVLRKEHMTINDSDEPTEWDDYEVDIISGKADCALYIYLKHKEGAI